MIDRINKKILMLEIVQSKLKLKFINFSLNLLISSLFLAILNMIIIGEIKKIILISILYKNNIKFFLFVFRKNFYTHPKF